MNLTPLIDVAWHEAAFQVWSQRRGGVLDCEEVRQGFRTHVAPLLGRLPWLLTRESGGEIVNES